MANSELHRFTWIEDDRIGSLPKEWNWLCGEYPEAGAKLLHYTIGTPCFPDYARAPQSRAWHDTYKRTIEPKE